MKYFNRFLIIMLSMMLCGIIPLMAQRDIKLKLNKLNFENFDTVKVEASFVGFEDDPVAGDVVADIVNPQDSVIQTVVMHRNADGTYYAELPVPPNELNSLRDIPKLCSGVYFDGDVLFCNGKRIPIFCYDYNLMQPNPDLSFDAYNKVPFSKFTYITVYPGDYRKYKKGIMDDLYVYLETQKSHPVDNIFSVQVSASLDSGEAVTGFKNITLPVIQFTTYHGDHELQHSPNNIFHNKWYGTYRF